MSAFSQEAQEDQKAIEAHAGLLERARAAAEAAYCPYSHFPVGAAVETDRGVFLGCNIENASYGLAICAERVALFGAIAAGARVFFRMAICCKNAGPSAPPGSRMPCGACRQVIAEFMSPDSLVLIDGAGAWRVDALLPQAFTLAENPAEHPTEHTTTEHSCEKETSSP